MNCKTPTSPPEAGSKALQLSGLSAAPAPAPVPPAAVPTQTIMSSNNILLLPEEIHNKILIKLDLQSVGRFCCTNKLAAQIIQNTATLWARLLGDSLAAPGGTAGDATLPASVPDPREGLRRWRQLDGWHWCGPTISPDDHPALPIEFQRWCTGLRIVVVRAGR